MMRAVAPGDVVTWGRSTSGYQVVRIVETGVYVNGEYLNQGVFFVPWSGDGTKAITHLCGDRIDCIASYAQRKT